MNRRTLQRSGVVANRRLAAEPVIALSMPVITASGDVVGVLIGALDLSAVGAAVGGMLNRPTTAAVVTDAAGLVMVGARATARADDAVQSEEVGRGGRPGAAAPARALVASATLERLGWTIHASLPPRTCTSRWPGSTR